MARDAAPVDEDSRPGGGLKRGATTMRKRIAMTVCAAAVLLLPAAAGAAPGQDIKAACGLSFGHLISGAKSSGTAAHSNYAGGANAFSDPAILAAHGCGG